MDNYSPWLAIVVGIVQIVIGMWFLAWGGYFGMLGLFVKNAGTFLAYSVWFITMLICAIFFSSGCLAITARKKALVKASFALSILSSITAFSLLTLSIAEAGGGTVSRGQDKALFYFFGLPALIMFIVTTFSAINSGIMVSYHLHIKSFQVLHIRYTN